MALSYTTTLRNNQLDQITTAVGASGLLRIYDATGGTPANVGTALGSQVLLAELTCNATFAPGASGGVLTLNAITQDSSANATGTAAFFRITTSGGTAIVQGTVGTSGADLNLNTLSIVINGPVAVSSFTITAANS
jgi:hypothetical protein